MIPLRSFKSRKWKFQSNPSESSNTEWLFSLVLLVAKVLPDTFDSSNWMQVRLVCCRAPNRNNWRRDSPSAYKEVTWLEILNTFVIRKFRTGNELFPKRAERAPYEPAKLWCQRHIIRERELCSADCRTAVRVKTFKCKCPYKCVQKSTTCISFHAEKVTFTVWK